MKRPISPIRFLMLAITLASSLYAKQVPTPEMAMSFAMNKDTVKWVPQFMDGNEAGIIFELVPEGQSIDAWKEMVAQQIVFTKLPLPKFVEAWKAGLVRSDPKIEFNVEKRDDGSMLASYVSVSGQEASLRRFIKAKDGIYMLAYHVRPSLKTDERWALWREIVTTASLVPNPEKKR